ncbi:substrate-specific component ThiW of thiazole ECF transporter [Staphylococcus piscifermentans]|uniref:Energy coupling factor transporter S component ThiW n=1 Tax=Staphylococcus piscifermentans TaxID=70258 RepID=A0A239U5L9_9STAP|nr:energy coupling factor transporter S component ThiW [Staphylococcus piscifermentans]RTX82343.1 energy coupling factor transporter S component ThiW [Staphylococcus piscifermentans]GEP84307.1 energy coupling factor transporter S component ThiW [Staphylococcus piscifermentans]SNV05142.1 substrate-specific component ThiW of thiazole ECF transporter [Staphylococcus piscifermentans]
MNVRKLTLTSMFIAINVVLSSIIVIPLGPIKAAPVQHMINVLCAVFVGPWYGLAQAFLSSVIRMIFGTGSAFAFPGSMVGVLLASLLYRYRKHLFMAAMGEVIGTGLIGSFMCIPLAWIIGLHSIAIKPLMLAFITSSALGAFISYVLLMILFKKGKLSRWLPKD